MGQKTNPIGLRLGIIKGWDSNWYGGKNFGEKLVEDDKIRKYLFARLSKAWQAEIEAMFTQVEQMYKAYQADAVLLPEDLKKKREDEIIKTEREAKELQRKRFGQDGDLFKKRQELIKPIQEKIFNAIEEIATKQNYAFIFDKASGPTIMYINARYNISDEVLDQIGSIMGVRKQ
jgi:outer membrane protein